jgi:methyltransferase
VVRAAIISAVVFAPMILEARRAASNERAQRARGGLEPQGDRTVYRVMQVAYPGVFAAMIAEALARGEPTGAWFAAGLASFGVAKALKWWAILTLGRFWTFRVIVVPGAPLVTTGPYRFLRHPNYVAVAGELTGTALMTGAYVCGPLAVVLFGILLKRRIAVEERALDSSARHPPCSL